MTGNALTICAVFRRTSGVEDREIFIVASTWARAAELARDYNEDELPGWQLRGMDLMSTADVLIDADVLQ